MASHSEHESMGPEVKMGIGVGLIAVVIVVTIGAFIAAASSHGPEDGVPLPAESQGGDVPEAQVKPSVPVDESEVEREGARN